MTTLDVGPQGDFVLRATEEVDSAAAAEAGLTLSTTASRPGQPVYFTRDPYAVLDFWPAATDKARGLLLDKRAEYETSFATDGLGNYAVPSDRQLFPFQRGGVEYALQRAHSLIGDQPGLGKTCQAIVVSNEIKARRTLVICPANVRRHWRKEILGWSTIDRPNVYLTEKGSDGVSPHAHYLVTSFDLSRTPAIHAALCAVNWDHVVIDEAHYLKTTDARRTRAAFGGGEGDFKELGGYASRAGKVTALTGTPLPNRPRECYTIARALCWDAIDWMSEDAFRFRYNPSFTWPSGKVEERVGRLPELQARLRCNFMVRRLKRDVLTQLPDKTYELALMEANAPVKRVLAAERAHGLHDMPLDEVFRHIAVDGKFGGEISTIRREMGEALAPQAVDHVEFLLDGGVDKLIVAYHHHSVGDIIQAGLEKYGVVRVDGGVSPFQKERRKEDFIMLPGIRVYLGQIDTMIGIDGLQGAASTVVFPEASWTPGQNEQAIDRLHRIGQKDAVLAQFIVVPGSFGERVIGNMISKAHDVHGALDKRWS